MDFQQLETLTMVIDLESFSKAAERLFLSQPTVSFHISSLEKELGAQLVVRTNKLVYASEQGQVLYDYAKRMLALRNEAVSAVTGADMTGNVCIAASTISAKYLLPTLIQGFRQENPGAGFNVMRCTPDQVAQKLLGGEVRLGLSGVPIDSAACYNDPIAVDSLVVVTPNTDHYRELGQDGFPAEALFREPFLYLTGPAQSQYDLAQYLPPASPEQKLNIVAELGDTEMLLHSVEAGSGISVVSQFAASDFSRFGRVLCFPLDNGQDIRKLYLVRPKKARLSHMDQLFVDYVLKHPLTSSSR